MALADAAFEALVLLAMLVLTSLVDVIALNFFLQARNPRAHNRLKVANECLARHQLAYPIWYITVMLLATFSKLPQHDAIVVRSWMQIAAIFSVLFWLAGLNAVAWQEDAILRHHKCEDARCAVLSFGLGFNLLIMNSVLAAISLTLAARGRNPSTVERLANRV